MKTIYVLFLFALCGIAIIGLYSCGLFCGGENYRLLPLSFNDRNENDSIDIVRFSTKIDDNVLYMTLRYHSNDTITLDRNQFSLYIGSKEVKPYFINNLWVNDTLRVSYSFSKNGLKSFRKKNILLRKGYNEFKLYANHPGRVFSKPLKLSFFPKNIKKESVIFTLDPENVVFAPRFLNLKAIYSEKTLLGDSIRMMFIGDVCSWEPSSLSNVKKEDMYVLKDSLKYFMLTFDRLNGYDVDPKRMIIHSNDSTFRVSTLIISPEIYKTRELINSQLPSILFTITDKKGKAVSNIPSLFLLPGEFICKNGKPIATDTIEIYSEKNNRR